MTNSANEPAQNVHAPAGSVDSLEADDLDILMGEDDEDEDDFDEDEDASESGLDALPAGPLEELDAEEKVRLMAEAADAVRAEDIVVLDLRGITIIADFFLICTGKSSIQLRAIADRMEEKLREHGVRKHRVQGYQEATWILLDFGDVVAHVMAAEQREFYSLEQFWNAAPMVELHLAPSDTGALRPIPARFQTLTPPTAEFAEEDELEEEELEALLDFEEDSDSVEDVEDIATEEPDKSLE